MLRERASAQARRLAAYAAEHCALLERRFTTRRACVYLRIAEDDPRPIQARYDTHSLGYEVRAPA